MPIYEYECEECGKVEESWQNFSDEPLTTCCHCSGKLNKLISQSSFHLKGSGWYVTDYASSSRSSSGTSKGANDTSGKKEPTKAPVANKAPAADKKAPVE